MIDKENEPQQNQLDKIEEGNEIIAENEEENYEEEDAEKIISELQEKISQLEKTNKELKSKLDSFTKKQNLNTQIFGRLAAAGLKKKFGLKVDVSKLQNNSVKIAELMKEKEELQQNNENMLDMLTEKEIENEELNEKFENYKLEVQKEKEKDMEKIRALEEKIESMEAPKNDTSFFKVLLEFDAQKEKLKQQLKDYARIEQDLNQQINEKDIQIKK